MDQSHAGFFLLNMFDNGIEKHTNNRYDLVAGLGKYSVGICCSKDLEVFKKDGVTAILSGHLYHRRKCSSLPGLYRKYAEKTGEHLAGSFTILLLDEIENKVIVITDRLASLPVFQYHHPGGWIVSSSCMHLASVIPENPALDLAGVAWYLTNGAIHNNHTLFAEIQRLERGTCYVADNNEISSHEYAKYDYFGAVEDRSITKWLDVIDVVVSGAVSDCIKNEHPLYFSLSGGNDSSAILGALKYRLHHPDVKTFSYEFQDENPLSDASRAVRLAELTGYEHAVIKSYNYDFISAIELNAAWGDGISNFCDETTVWSYFAGLFQNTRPACLFGDTAFAGRFDHKLEDDSDLLRNAMVRSISLLSWTEQYIGQELYKELQDVLDLENDILIRKSRENSPDLMYQLCYLYVYSRGKDVLFPWRANFCNRAFRSFNPLYHDDCLELSRTIPASLRKNKKLFIMALEKTAPDFIPIKKAQNGGYIADWKGELRKHLPVIKEQYLSERISLKIDDLIPPELMLRIIKNEINREGGNHSSGPAMNFIRGFGKSISFRQKKLKGSTPKKMPPEKFILRYLVLRRTLEMVAERRRNA